MRLPLCVAPRRAQGNPCHSRPRSPAEPGAPPIGTLPTAADSGRAVLIASKTLVMIVDHDVHVRRAMAGVLEGEGYDVLSVASGEAALARLAMGAQPSIVIIGFWLRGMKVLELVRRLRGRSDFVAPYIVLTASPAATRRTLSRPPSQRFTAAPPSMRDRDRKVDPWILN